MSKCNCQCDNCPDEKIQNWSADWKAACKRRTQSHDMHEVKQMTIVDPCTGECILHTYVVSKNSK